MASCVTAEKSFFVFMLLFLWTTCCWSIAEQSPNQLSLVVGSSTKLRLPHGLETKLCHDSKFKTSMVCERIHIHGYSRVKNLDKLAHSLIVKISGSNSGVYLPKAQVCFHMNTTLGLGMCPDKNWETILKSSWARSISPFDHRLLDIRTVGPSLESFEVSIEEEFCLYRVVYLVLGIVMMSLDHSLSNSAVFYYAGCVASGAILVTLMVFYQGLKKAMQIFSTSPKTTLLTYSSIVGLLSFLLYHFHAFWHSILTEVGIDEVFSYTLGVFLLGFIVLDGSWVGFWLVRKCILTEEGLVDSRTARFVEWSIGIFGGLLIIQSSLDLKLRSVALLFGIAVSLLLKRIFRLRIFRRIYRKVRKSFRRKHDSSTFDDTLAEDYTLNTPSNEDLRFPSRSERFHVSPLPTAYHDFFGSSSRDSSPVYLSTFHATPERRRFSKPEWEKFTRDSTKKAMGDLVSSPDFTRWVSENADRITITPPSGTRAEHHQRKWFQWF